jgi:hypothetical protein
LRQDISEAEKHIKDYKPKRNEDYTAIERVKQQISTVSKLVGKTESDLAKRLDEKEELQTTFFELKDEEHNESSFKRNHLIKNAKHAVNLIKNKKGWIDELKKLEEFESGKIERI